jgi:phosphopantothenoylcysteine decarboxylase/phosphopantothenate--cysteine ligase
MLGHATVQQNVAVLRARGVHVIEPDAGLLACGDEGAGRMPDPEVLAERAAAILGPRDLAGVAVLVTAGPTREAIDPVRYISNRSSGKMGYAIAEAAKRRGARVTLVSGPTALESPAGVELVKITSAAEMHRVVMERAAANDVVVKAAAVADFAPEFTAEKKIKKQEGVEELRLTLRKTPDILGELGALAKRPFLVAFAAETNDVVAHAREKLAKKNADVIVANDVSDASIGFDSGQNEVVVIARDGSVVTIAKASKGTVANRILDVVVAKREAASK